MVCSCSHDPRLCRMELCVQHAQVILDLVSSKHLQRDDQCVVYKVASPHGPLQSLLVDSGVEDVNGSIVGAGAHQRILRMELDLPNRLLVVAQRLVGSGSQVQVEPRESGIEAPHHHIVAAWMNLLLTPATTLTAIDETHLTPVRSLLTSVCLTRL